ncbi:ATP-sensitive inward rectifier potassium channel 1 [Phlebotomus argentipes]|uniref:ATP-sensitive inward rectifier potassium channel 1 n=1 Tax=Phlebotomus argentipes TaxID=94469 RepID=UPI002892F3C3|nr:ATP-sensitive inward rectifier potassium channel 1 [Phlebotomus argentipes]
MDQLEDGGGSPYARRFPNVDKFTFELRAEDEIHKLDLEQRFTLRKSFQSAPNSPYAKRRNQEEAGIELQDVQVEQKPESVSSEEDLDTVQMDGESHQLPVALVRRPSMQSLRQRRDPLYQGTRSRRTKRVIHRNGKTNVTFHNIPQRSARFFKDFVTTLIEEQWRYTLALFAFTFFFCWILFAMLWYLIAYAHGDLSFDPETGERLGDGERPCIMEATCMASFLLFSIETQVGIGFGTRFPTEECPEALFLMVVQLILSVAIEGAMVGIVYAKMVRPTKASSVELKFSRKAVICCHDGKLCLMFRVCDTQESHVIGTTIKGFWLEAGKSREHTLALEDLGHLFLIWPTTVVHVIDAKSPLYDVSARDLLNKHFEIVVTMTGGCRSTGQLTQTRTSYLPRDILWGHKFDHLLTYSHESEAYVADYEKFDSLTQIDTPLCSARRLEEIFAEVTNMMHHDFYASHSHIRRISEGSWEGSEDSPPIMFDAARHNSHPDLKSI